MFKNQDVGSLNPEKNGSFQFKSHLRYDFEQNKRNNLIFYGVPGEERESRDDLR